LTGILGKPELVKALGTRDLSEAKRRLRHTLADFESQLDVARRVIQGEPLADPLLADARSLRALLALGKIDPETAGDTMGAAADALLKDSPIDPATGEPVVDPELLQRIRSAHSLVTNHDATLYSDALDTYLTEKAETIRASTVQSKRNRLEAFQKWLGGDVVLATVTRKRAGQYVTQALMPQDTSVKTKRDTLSDLSAFFRWCSGRGLYDGESPFTGLASTIRGNTRGTKEATEAKRREWSKEELQTLITKTDPKSDLWWMPVIALYSGARENEIAEVRIEDVHDDHFDIQESKTKAGVRPVPIHPVIKPLVKWLKENATDDYLIPGLQRGGKDDKRHHYYAKRFSYHLRKNLKVTAPGVVFHSLRNTFITAALDAQVPEAIISRLVGHTGHSLAARVYAGKLDLGMLAGEVAKVSYGDIDGMVSQRFALASA
jgi:integrase